MRSAVPNRIGNIFALVLVGITVFAVCDMVFMGPSWLNRLTPLHVGAFWVLAVLTMVVFWFVQFLDLMHSPESRFPARSDKAIWAALFILLAPVAPLVFWCWKSGRNER